MRSVEIIQHRSMMGRSLGIIGVQEKEATKTRKPGCGERNRTSENWRTDKSVTPDVYLLEKTGIFTTIGAWTGGIGTDQTDVTKLDESRFDVTLHIILQSKDSGLQTT